MLRFLRIIFKLYLISTGIIAPIALLAAGWFALDHYQLTLPQAILKVLDKAELDMPRVEELVSPKPRYTDHLLDGSLRARHPRILLPELANWQGGKTPQALLRRLSLYGPDPVSKHDPCKRGDIMNLTTCWVSSGRDKTAQLLLTKVRNFQLKPAHASGTYGNAWQLILAYDFLSLYPQLTDSDRADIEERIEASLITNLHLLDSYDPSLWHGRSSLAANAWLHAAVLEDNSEERRQLIRRAQGHFLDAVEAWETTEAWPEGFNYWIQNRAFLLALAGTAYVNSLENSENEARIRQLLQRSGYWHIYATRPDARIEGLGDEGSRVDLKDETRRVIDIFAQTSKDSLLAHYSTVLANKHGRESYHRGYRWGFRLFNDPSLNSVSDAGMRNYSGILPTADIFGRDAFNQVYIRSNWDKDATFISFRAGDSFTHHGHYDAGHFTLFKGAPLAVNSSRYQKINSANRLYYSIRSIAKNTLLIQRPGESVRPNRFFTDNVADGGQRLTLPTGSAISSVNHWSDNLDSGLHLRGGAIKRYEHNEGHYTYIEADLTAAYNNPDHDEGGRGGKVERVIRSLLYLYLEDRLLVHDQVASVKPAYLKKWLLHSITQPQIDGLKILRGQADDGILESAAASALIQNGEAYLRLDRFYPEDAVMRTVGGPHYQYYVETDGDDSTLDGHNYSEGAANKPWFDNGQWRIEIQPGASRHLDTFLVALSPSLAQPRNDRLTALSTTSDHLHGIISERSLTLFINTDDQSEAHLQLPGERKSMLVAGLPARAEVELFSGVDSRKVVASANGIAIIDLNGFGEAEATLNWR